MEKKEVTYKRIRVGYDKSKRQLDFFYETCSETEVETVDVEPTDNKYYLQVENILNLDYISNLPDEMLLEIFKHLDLPALRACSEVNRKWQSITWDYTLYKSHLLYGFSTNQLKINLNLLGFLIKRCNSLRDLHISLRLEHVTPTMSIFFVRFFKDCCKALTSLFVTFGGFLRPEMLSQIGQLEELRVLHLNQTTINPNAFSHLSALSNLVELSLSTTNVNNDSLINILRNNPSLEHLYIDNCSNIDNVDDVITVITKYNIKLKTWTSRGNASLTDFGVEKFSKCVHLQKLDLHSCPVVFSENNLDKFSWSCIDLEDVVITNWHDIDDDRLFYLLRDLRNLNCLQLSHNTKIDDSFYELIFEHFPKLRYLKVSFCSLKNELLQQWQQQYPHVLIENLYQCACAYV